MSTDPPEAETQSRDLRSATDASLQRIGPYKVLETLGEGGFGIVYLAEQTRPVHRRVALKVIKPGMDSKAVLARFEAEEQALALMDHPNVAKVFSAGTTEQGRPYFAMEHVLGVSITEHCDRQKLSIEERLDLFMKTCDAVQHAHQKGVIHRDIKPSNILVTFQDGQPVPKVIDFGVAKAISQPLTERTLFTEQGQLIGTPAYMSPEQAEMTAQDIDTRTDIYSLGVLLYELLTGALPFDPASLRQAAFDEIRHIIREVEPPKPSTKLSSMMTAGGDDSTTAARNRRADPRTLNRELRGDLDWITMKALEKDRARRYATASDFAADIRRHLSHEPVVAGPPSARYRLRKFVRRNKGPVAAVVAVVLTLTAGVAATGWMYAQALAERDRAVEAETLTRQSLEEIQEARAEAEAVTQFLTDTLSSIDPEKEGKNVTVREVFDRAAKSLGEKFADKPLIRARLHHTIGSTYSAVGLYDKAEAHLADAAAAYRRLKGERHPATLAAMNNLAAVLGYRGECSASEARHRAILEIQRRVLGEEHPDTLCSVQNLASSLSSQGRYAEAERLYRKTVEIQRGVLGEEHPNTLNATNALASSLSSQGRYAEAETLHRKTLQIQRRVLGEEHPNTLNATNALAISLSSQGRYAEAETLSRKTLETMRRVLGEENPNTLGLMNALAVSLHSQGRYIEAETLYRKTLEILCRVLGEEHPNTLKLMFNVSLILRAQGRNAEAEMLEWKTHEIQRRVLGEEHPDTLASMNSLASSLGNQGRYTEAETLYRKTLGIQRRVLGEEHADTLVSMNDLASSLGKQGHCAEAETLYRKTLDIMRRTLGEEHPVTLTSMSNLASSLGKQGHYAEAETLNRKTLEIRRRVLGEEHPDVAESLAGLAAVLEKTEHWAEGETLCRQGGSILALRLPLEHRDRQANTNLLGSILCGLGRYTEAEPLLLGSYEALRGDPGVAPDDKEEMLERLLRLYESWDAAEPGKGYAEKAAKWRAKLEVAGTDAPRDKGTRGEEPGAEPLP